MSVTQAAFSCLVGATKCRIGCSPVYRIKRLYQALHTFVRIEVSLPSILTFINLVIHVSKRCFMKKNVSNIKKKLSIR